MKLSDVLCYVCVLASCVRSEHLIHTVDGQVGRGNYTYYSLMYDGAITLFLYSLSGDADLYVSQFVPKPTFEPENYCLQSSTCGLDVVYIATDFKRPVGIGVYGHPSHESSTYVLEVYESESDHNNESLGAEHESGDRDERERESWDGLEGEGRARAARADEGADYERRDAASQQQQGEEPREESVFWSLIWSFLDLFVEILFL